MNNRTFRLHVNNQYFGEVEAPENVSHQFFVDYVTSYGVLFDPSKNSIDVEDVTPEVNTCLRHPSHETNPHHYYSDQIIDRHIKNLIATFGEDRVDRVLATKYRRAS